MMGGTIRLKSEEGVGSEFDVCLTFRLTGEPKVYRKVESLQGLRVLVADDDTDTCLSVSSMLTEIGMRSEWTVSGKEAVIRAKHAMEMGDAFYAYIIDWLMPDMNGIETGPAHPEGHRGRQAHHYPDRLRLVRRGGGSPGGRGHGLL